jgi:hypothetical protein
MDGVTATVLITVAFCALWAVQAITGAIRPRACNCPCQKAHIPAPTDPGK